MITFKKKKKNSKNLKNILSFLEKVQNNNISTQNSFSPLQDEKISKRQNDHMNHKDYIYKSYTKGDHRSHLN